VNSSNMCRSIAIRWNNVAEITRYKAFAKDRNRHCHFCEAGGAEEIPLNPPSRWAFQKMIAGCRLFY